jgi:serine/threonine protein kinase
MSQHWHHNHVPSDDFVEGAWSKRIAKANLIGSTQIGQGSFGKIYRSSYCNIAVALKEVGANSHGRLDTDMEHLAYELSSLLQLKHPNVINLIGAVMDFAAHNAVSMSMGLVLELCPYGSLHHILFEARHNLSIRRKVLIGGGVAAGLAHIHGMSILHRDLNTANVLLAEGFEPKIADFGCSVCLTQFSSPDRLPHRLSHRKSMIFVQFPALLPD